METLSKSAVKIWRIGNKIFLDWKPLLFQPRRESPYTTEAQRGHWPFLLFCFLFFTFQFFGFSFYQFWFLFLTFVILLHSFDVMLMVITHARRIHCPDIFVRQHFSTGDGWHNLFTMPDQLFSYHWRKRRIAISAQKRFIQGRLMLRLSHILVGLKLNFTDWKPAKNTFHSNISDIYANVGEFSERCRKWETSHCK